MSTFTKLFCLFFIACSSSASLFSENWELGVIDNSKWNSWGYPLPNNLPLQISLGTIH